MAKLNKRTLNFIRIYYLNRLLRIDSIACVCMNMHVCVISEFAQDLFLLSEEFYTVDLVHIH